MAFPTVTAGTWKSFGAGSRLATGHAADTQALFTTSGQYLTDFLGGSNGGGNGTWAYSGLTFDSLRNRVQSICNGGDPDGADNGHYEFDIEGTQSWGSGPVFAPTFHSDTERLMPRRPTETASDVYTDTLGHFGTAGAQYPCSRHSYYGNVFVPGLGPNGTVWLAGGSRWWEGAPCDEVWFVDPVTHIATLQTQSISEGLGISAAADPHNPGIIYYHGHNRLLKYDMTQPDGSRITALTGDEADWTQGAQACTFDWRRRRFVMVGGRCGPSFSAGLLYYDLFNGAAVTRVTPAPPFPDLTRTVAPGLTYDTQRDLYILWIGNSAVGTNLIYAINPDTLATTVYTPGGDTPPVGDILDFSSWSGTYNRFFYYPPQDVCLLFTRCTDPVFAFKHPDQSLTNGMANRTWNDHTKWALGAGPAGGAQSAKHGRWTVDTTRQLPVKIDGEITTSAEGINLPNNFANETWRGHANESGPAWTLIHKQSIGPEAGVVPDRPDTCPVWYDDTRDEYGIMPGFYGGNQSNRATLNAPISSASGITMAFTITLIGGTGWWGDDAGHGFPASSGTIQLRPPLGVGGQQECATWSLVSQSAAGIGGVVTVQLTARGVSGTTAKAFASGDIVVETTGRNEYANLNPSGPVSDVFTAYRMPAGTLDVNGFAYWQRAPWPTPSAATDGSGNVHFPNGTLDTTGQVIGYGSETQGSFGVYDAGTTSLWRSWNDGGWGFSWLRLNRTTNAWTRYRVGFDMSAPSGFRDAVVNRSNVALDGKGRALYLVIWAGSTFGTTPILAKLDLSALTMSQVAVMPSGYQVPTDSSYEQWIFFDPLNRLVLVPNNPAQFSGPTSAFLLYHVEAPTTVFNTTVAGWEQETQPAFTIRGNAGVFDPYRNHLLWMDDSGTSPADYFTYRYGPGPAFGTSASFFLSNLSPSLGIAGTHITLTGSGFGATQGTSVVNFGSGTATVFAWSSTSVSATVPAVAQGVYNVSLTVGGLTSNSLQYTLQSAAPVITAITPSSGVVATAPQITIQGLRFGVNQSVSSLTIGGVFAPVVSWSDTVIVATVPTTLGVGTFTVTVTTVNGSGSGTYTNTYPNPTPSIAWTGLLRDRVGQSSTALAPDGALDGTFTVTLAGVGGGTVVALRLDMFDASGSTIGIWSTQTSLNHYVLGVADTLDNIYRNNTSTMAVNFFVADGGSFVCFASDFNGIEFLNGNVATLTVTFADLSTKQCSVTLGPPVVGITLLPFGRGNF